MPGVVINTAAVDFEGDLSLAINNTLQPVNEEFLINGDPDDVLFEVSNLADADLLPQTIVSPTALPAEWVALFAASWDDPDTVDDPDFAGVTLDQNPEVRALVLGAEISKWEVTNGDSKYIVELNTTQGFEKNGLARQESPQLPGLEPAKSRVPSPRTTVVAFALLLPSRDWLPSTVTTSPIFIEFRDQPRRISPFGLPISQAQFVTAPVSSSRTSM